MRCETDAAKGGRGTRMQQNFTSEQTQRANFDFVPAFLCLPRLLQQRLWLFTRTALFKLRQFTSSCFLLFCIRSYLQTFPSFVENSHGPSVGPGVSPRCVSAGGCHTVFFAASPSEMSCPVRKIVKPSRSRAACGV